MHVLPNNYKLACLLLFSRVFLELDNHIIRVYSFFFFLGRVYSNFELIKEKKDTHVYQINLYEVACSNFSSIYYSVDYFLLPIDLKIVKLIRNPSYLLCCIVLMYMFWIGQFELNDLTSRLSFIYLLLLTLVFGSVNLRAPWLIPRVLKLTTM